MTTPTDENRNLLTVIAHCRAKPGREDELKAALEALVDPTSKEQGFVNYDLHQGVEDPLSFYLYENWDSAEDLDTHLAAPHLVEFARRKGEWVDDAGLTVTRLRRIA